MKRQTTFWIGMSFVLIFSTACNLSGNNPTTEAGNVNEAVTTESPAHTEPPATLTIATPEPVIAGSCTNAYYPVREGSTWSYASTGGPTGGYNFTDTITALRADGYTLTTQFGEVTRTQDWACTPTGLVALQLGGGAVQTQNLNLQVETQTASGVTYPAEIQPGDQWDYALEFTGQMDLAGNSGEAKGSVTNHFNALGVESVTVPAGTFEALKIQVDTTMSIQVTFQGVTVPVQFTSSYFYWFVKDTGWVKAQGGGEMGGQAFTETIEMQWFNLP